MAQPPQEPQEPAQGLTVTSLEELYKLTKAQFTIVTSIALPNRSLNDVENLEEFFKCLAQCTDLRKLDLRYNNLGPEGAKALAPVLGKLIQLQCHQ